MTTKRRDELVREFTVNLPRDVYVQLSQLQLRRVEQNYRPREATRSAIICDAIRAMASRELNRAPKLVQVPAGKKSKGHTHTHEETGVAAALPEPSLPFDKTGTSGGHE